MPNAKLLGRRNRRKGEEILSHSFLRTAGKAILDSVIIFLQILKGKWAQPVAGGMLLTESCPSYIWSWSQVPELQSLLWHG